MRKTLTITISATVLMIVSLLSGCADTKPMVQTRAVTPEDIMLVDCDVSPPPATAVYMRTFGTALDDAQMREKLMAQYARTLLTDIDTCNKRFKALRYWKGKVKKEFPPDVAGK